MSSCSSLSLWRDGSILTQYSSLGSKIISRSHKMLDWTRDTQQDKGYYFFYLSIFWYKLFVGIYFVKNYFSAKATVYKNKLNVTMGNHTGLATTSNETRHEKKQNNNNGWAPSEDSDQPGHPPSLIRVFAVRLKKAWVLSYPFSAQRRLSSDWADAQADRSLRCAHTHFVDFVMSRLEYRSSCDNWKVFCYWCNHADWYSPPYHLAYFWNMFTHCLLCEMVFT